MRSKSFPVLYLGLIIVRLGLSLSPSYIHPDEFFQGPEIVIGDLLGWNTTRTWEFSGHTPIRSILPIYLFFGPAVIICKWLYGFALGPSQLLVALRCQAFLQSLLLDGLIYLSTQSLASVLLIASSYVIWTYQTHTFSNSVESLLVMATIWMCSQSKSRYLLLAGCLAAIGCFTRITFAAFLLPIGLDLFLGICKRGIFRLFLIVASFTLFSGMLILCDSLYYSSQTVCSTEEAGVSESFNKICLVVTPWNNYVYNSNTANLSQHGLHPRYTHFGNLILLLGPLLLLFKRVRWNKFSASFLCGFLFLTAVPHQEARFLLPCLPLWIAALSYRLPVWEKPIRIWPLAWRIWLVLWIGFNVTLGIFMGIFHQCGVVRVSKYIHDRFENITVTWVDSYPTPQFLVGPRISRNHIYGNIETVPKGTELFVSPVSTLISDRSRCVVIYNEGWHVNLDDLGDNMEVFWQPGLGVYDCRETS